MKVLKNAKASLAHRVKNPAGNAKKPPFFGKPSRRGPNDRASNALRAALFSPRANINIINASFSGRPKA